MGRDGRIRKYRPNEEERFARPIRFRSSNPARPTHVEMFFIYRITRREKGN